jgi:gliding motility-associated-like protein
MKRYVYIMIFAFCGGSLTAQHTTQGRDFWISFGDNGESFYSTLTFQVRIVTKKTTKVTFGFTNLGTSSAVTLDAGSVYTYNLSDEEKQAVYSNTDGITDKSLHVESDEDISVYAINLAERSTDATAILPVQSLGKSYYHVSYNPIYSDGYTLVAIDNGTKIYENGIYKCTLNKGNVYSQYFRTDMTGQQITADKPVAYFTTNSCVYVPKNVIACDCLYEQLFPETAWGTSFMVPVTVRGKERVRIVASTDGTQVTHIGGTVVSGSLNLNTGQYVEIEISKNGVDENGVSYDGCYIEANNPVAVASYLTGLEYDNLIYNGDPAMTWIPSIEQAVSELLLAPFMASGSSLLVEHHVLIVTSTRDKNLTEIGIGNNGYTTLSGGQWTDHVSGYSFYSTPLTIADQSYRFRNPGGITVLGYGLGHRESYYYLSGSATRKLSAAFYINDVHYQDLDGKEFCSDKFDIEAVVKYNMHSDAGHLRWFVDGVEEFAAQDRLQWTKTFSEDSHTISLIVKDSVDDVDTLNVLLTVKIQTIDVSDTTVCKGKNAELKVNNPTDQLIYRWYADAAFSEFIRQGATVTSPLTSDTVFYVEATSNIGCSIRDSIKVNLYPVVDLQTEDIEACNDLTVEVEASSDNAVSFKWYGDADFSDFIIQARSFETAKLENDTVFYVEALSSNGCIARDSVKIGVYSVRTDDLAICYDETATISVSAADIASVTWYRNPDYSSVIADAKSFSTAKLRSDTTFYLETVSAKGCIAKNSMTVTVNSFPELTVGDTSVCAGTKSTFTVATDAVLLKWYNNPAYKNPIAQSGSYTASLYADTVFYIEAFSNGTCSIRDSFKVSVIQLPEVTAMDDRYLCYGEEITLDVVRYEGAINWNVNPLTFKPQSTGEYTVTASRPPCPDVRDSVVITVGDSLYIVSSALPSYQPYTDYSHQLNTNADSPDYTLIRGNLPFGLFLYPTGEISGIPNGDDLVSIFTVQVEDKYSCIATQEFVMERDFYIPRMFTPNGDGINDVFMPGHEITVFDRMGVKIFNGANGWDGTYDNKLALQDIYFYTLTRKLENGKIKVYNGYVGINHK